MLTQDDLSALFELLRRVPLTRAEMLWLNNFIAKLQQEIADRPQTTTEEVE